MMHGECSQMKSCKLIPARKMFLLNAVEKKRKLHLPCVYFFYGSERCSLSWDLRTGHECPCMSPSRLPRELRSAVPTAH